MIVVDCSIIVAIIRNEDDAAIWEDVLDRSDGALMSVVSYVETNMVIAGRRTDFEFNEVDNLLRALGIDLVEVSIGDGIAPLRAFTRYGKGRHSARLNLADCLHMASPEVESYHFCSKAEIFP